MPAATTQGSDDHLAFLKQNSSTIEFIWNKIKTENENVKENRHYVPDTKEYSISSPYSDPSPGFSATLWSKGFSKTLYTVISYTSSLSTVYTCPGFLYLDILRGIAPFDKWHYIHYTRNKVFHLLTKSLTENLIFCAVILLVSELWLKFSRIVFSTKSVA